MKQILDLFLHVDKNLISIVAMYGGWSYAILFLVIFMETGLVVTPFLPGDSLLFAAGALSAFASASADKAAFSFNIINLWLLMWVAAFLGDTVNYWMGHFIGPKAFESNSKLLKKEYLTKAQAFYEKHGGKAIVLARFVPIVRTFAPFVAGAGEMSYGKFISFNLIGGLMWVSLFVFGGYMFGNLPMVRDNFHYTVLVIVLISVIPIGLEVIKSKRKENKAI